MSLWSLLFPSRRPSETDVSGELRRRVVDLAPGRGFTTRIVGESHYQRSLDRIVGGKAERGCNLPVKAELVLDDGNRHDPNAIAVHIKGALVGFIPRTEATVLRADLQKLNPSRLPVMCDGKIVGGWASDDGDEGHYGVKLSLSKPLRTLNP